MKLPDERVTERYQNDSRRRWCIRPAKSYIAHMPDPVIPSAETFHRTPRQRTVLPSMTPRAGNNPLPGAGSGIYGRPSDGQTLARIPPAHQHSQHPQDAVRRRPTLNRGITDHHKRNMVQQRLAQGLAWRIIRVQEDNINHCHFTITIIDRHLCFDSTADVLITIYFMRATDSDRKQTTVETAAHKRLTFVLSG
jgi:hypothetical protein